MVDHPLRRPCDHVQLAEPTLVPGGQETDEGIEQQQCLPVRAPLLGLPDGGDQCPDGLGIADADQTKWGTASATRPEATRLRASCRCSATRRALPTFA